MAKSNQQINKESGTTVQETTLAVVDYRMGQVEIGLKENSAAVREGFAAHDKKLEALTSNFATKEELAVIKSRLDDYQWYFRALATAFLIAIATGVGTIIIHR